ncbi:unnamed protein product [Angiostrongylus costaricensis]|uniref:Transcription factor 25 n=1 Tax=Angiostrongylus costaricensis TaxID=334426 RepID=A0A0R3PLT2_ANGCS|nr:unnamed protein product [Angiostrongylus costaricensis]
MSTKHLRRMLQEREQQEEVKESLDEEELIPRRTGPLNRFAALQDDDDNDETAKKSEGGGGHNSEKSDEERHLRPKAKDKRKTNKKKKNRQEGKEEETISVAGSLAGCEARKAFLMSMIGIRNRTTTPEIEANEHLGVAELLKPDPRLFDPAAELKRALGKTFKYSRITNLCCTTVVRINHEYDSVQCCFGWLCWAVEDEKVFDPGLIKEILVGNPYHLNSLILLANIFHMQEDITESCDMIERGIFYCEQCLSGKFQLSSFFHRIDYLDYENRAFYLLLHRHMMNCVHKRNLGNLDFISFKIFEILTLKDPLAVLLVIDTIAIKAKQYSWFKDFYQRWKEWKNLNVLPNFCYSAALAQFLDAKTDEDFDVADQLLTQAICAFPGVISMLLDKLQIEPDPLVESHHHLGTFARNKESDGVKLVFKIYVNEAAELWKVPETLSWLEHVTRSCAERQHCTNEMKIWREKRKRLFVGVPLNIRRLAVLLGLEPSSSTVTDPVAPLNGRARHVHFILYLPTS